MNNRAILVLLLSFSTLLPVMGQTKPAAPPQSQPGQRQQTPPATDDNDEVVKITTNLVQIDAVVTKDGKPVSDLTADDFEIYEDRRRQTITSFAYISNVANQTSEQTPKKKTAITTAPPESIKRDVARRTIAVVVDDLGLSFESISQVRRQVRNFIDEQVQPNDLIAIIRTGGDMGILQQFTNDKRLLNRAADQLRWNYCSRTGITIFPRANMPTMRGDTRDPCGGISLKLTMRALQSILDAMGHLPGRKSMILMSDNIPRVAAHEVEPGISVGTHSTNYTGFLQRIAEKAIRSSVVVYSVDTQGLQFTGFTAADPFNGDFRRPINPLMNGILDARSRLLQDRREGSELIAKQTGGFKVHNSNGFQLDRILEDQSGYYLLGYRPTDETFNKEFHHIKAKVKRSGMTLRTRSGFFGVSEEEANRGRLSPRDQTNLALVSPFGAQDLQLDLASFFASDKSEGSIVRSFVYLDATELSFASVKDRHETSLEIHGVVFGNNGTIVEQVKHGAVLHLNDNEYEQAMRAGLRLIFDMPAKQAGSYQVRIAVRDRTSSKIGSAGQFVGVPDLKKRALAVSGIVLGDDSALSKQTTIMNLPGARRFPRNSDLYFALMIYNSPIDPLSGSPKLVVETKLFRDGKNVGPTTETVVDAGKQADVSSLFTSGVVRLGPDLEPGNYYLQVTLTDSLAKAKQPPVVQWVDFEIVK